MSDIFEIKSRKIELRIGDKLYQIKDPKFSDKMMIQKEFSDLGKQKEAMDESDYLIKAHELTKKSIKLFIPSMTDDVLEGEIPESSYPLLMKTIGELAEKNFGSSIEKSDAKK